MLSNNNDAKKVALITNTLLTEVSKDSKTTGPNKDNAMDED